MDLTFCKRSIERLFLAVWAVVVAAGCGSLLAELALDSEANFAIRLFGLGYEHNLPTWYVSCLLLLCALVLALIAVSKRRQRLPYVTRWWILAGAFLYISCDEAATIHENCCGYFNSHGVLFYGWVVPGMIVVVGMGILFLTFLGHLPRPTRRRFVIAGSIYVGGALLLDMACAYLHEQSGTNTVVYGIVDLVEEALETLGITLFLLALLDYVSRGSDTLRLSIQAGGEQPARGKQSGSDHNGSASPAVAVVAAQIAAESPHQGLPD